MTDSPLPPAGPSPHVQAPAGGPGSAPAAPPAWSLSRKAAVLALAGVFAALCDILLAREMQVESYGTYREVRTLLGFLLPCMTFGLVEGLSFLMPRIPAERHRVAAVQTLLALFSLGVVAGVGLLVLREPLARQFNNPVIADLLWLAAIFAPFHMSVQSVGTVLICRDRVPLATGIGLVFSTIYLTAMILAWQFAPTPAGALAFLVSGLVLQWGIGIGTVLRVMRGLPGGLDAGLWRRQWSTAWPLGLSAILGVATNFLDQLWIMSSVGAGSYALYWIGTAQMSFLNHFTGAVNNVMVPELSRRLGGGRLDSAFELWHTAIRRMSLIVFPIVAFAWVMADPLIVAVFGAKYQGAVTLFRIACFTILFKAVTFRALFLGAGRTKVMAWGSLGLLVVTVALIAAFTSWMGVKGAAAAVLVASWLLASYFTIELCRMFGRPLRSVFPWGPLARALGLAAVAGAAAWPFRTPEFLSPSPILRCAAGAAAFGGVYVIGVLATGALNAEERGRLRAFLRPAFDRTPGGAP